MYQYFGTVEPIWLSSMYCWEGCKACLTEVFLSHQRTAAQGGALASHPLLSLQLMSAVNALRRAEIATVYRSFLPTALHQNRTHWLAATPRCIWSVCGSKMVREHAGITVFLGT